MYAWFALPKGSGELGGLNYEAIRTPDAVTHNPYDINFAVSWDAPPPVFGAMQTFDGSDPSHMRQGAAGTTTSGVQVFVEEETCTDSEMAHTTETVGIVAIQTGVAGTDAGDPCEGLGDNSAVK